MPQPGQMPGNPMMPRPGMPPQGPGQRPGMPQGPQMAGQRPAQQRMNPQAVAAQLDQREQQLKGELKKIEAARTLLGLPSRGKKTER